MDRELTGFILAGGESRRMGTPKAFVRLNGKQLIDYAWEALKEVAPRVILSAGKLPLSYRDLSVVQDLFVDHGPVGGIYSALRSSPTELNLVLSCDMPFVSVDLLNLLVDAAANHPFDITLPVDEQGLLQPLCAVYRKSMVPYLERAILQKELKLKTIIQKVNYQAIPIEKSHPVYHSRLFYNMNTPEDIVSQTIFS